MKLGILFPVAIFIIAVVFLGWFFVGGYAAWTAPQKLDTQLSKVQFYG